MPQRTNENHIFRWKVSSQETFIKSSIEGIECPNVYPAMKIPRRVND